LPERRYRALARIDRERAQVAAGWRSLGGIVRQRERGTLAVAQGVATMVKLGAAAAGIWLAGRIRGPRLIRRGVMLLTAARAAGRLVAPLTRTR
jgi:hypothetical protein